MSIDQTLTVTQSVKINTDPETLWKVLTDPEIIKKYLYGTETITDWKEGSSIVFQGEWEGKAYKDKGIIKKFDPHKKIEYTYWSGFSGLEDIPENYSLVSYTIVEGTPLELRISQQGFAAPENQQHGEKSWRDTLQEIKKIAES